MPRKTGQGAGAANMERYRHYQSIKDQLLADVDALGVKAALKKHGVPPSTWVGLRRRWGWEGKDAALQQANTQIADLQKRLAETEAVQASVRFAELIRNVQKALGIHVPAHFADGMEFAARLAEVA